MDLRKNGLLSKLKSVIRSRLGISPSWVNVNLLNKEFTVRKGAIHSKEDYDDAWLLALAIRARTVIDVGANIGQAAFVILYSDSVNELVIVEPNPYALALASESLIRNHLIHRTRLVCAFAAGKAGEEVRFWTVGAGAAGSMYAEHANSAAHLGRSFKVPTTTLDALCELYNFTPDLVKIDTEGAESLVLTGSKRLALERRTRFFVEMHSSQSLPMVENANRVIDWCEQMRFRAWYPAEHVMLKEAEQIKHRGRCHLLLQPDDWEYPSWLRSIKQGASLESALKYENSDPVN